jgi:hypothetical protein
MKLRWKILMGIGALGLFGGFLALVSGNGPRRQLEATRRLLHEQGFKTDLKEFDLSLTPEESRRAAAMATTTRAAMGAQRLGPGRPSLANFMPPLMKPAGKDVAVVVWEVKTLRYDNFVPTGADALSDVWEVLKESSTAEQERLEEARQAAVSGPIRFEPLGGLGPSALLPYLADLRQLATSFAADMLLALRAGAKTSAWTNLLASTCLVTAYQPEPIDVSQMVRMACATTAYETLWNGLQSHDWTEAQLAELQSRWEAVDFWSRLPDTVAFARASLAATFEMDRQQPVGPALSPQQMLNSPKNGWSALVNYWQDLQYRHSGSYEDEKTLLMDYKDREVEMRNAIKAATWAEMKQMPAATNMFSFRARRNGRAVAMLSMRAMSIARMGQGGGLLDRAAEAESRRRLIVTALALERYRLKHGNYPSELQALVPEFLKSPPIDFMDGKPLRYRVGDDGHFVLYSVGLDCVDGGGEMGLSSGPEFENVMRFRMRGGLGTLAGHDLVWPRPASAGEEEQLHQREKDAETARILESEKSEAKEQWVRTAIRQSKVERILAAPAQPTTKVPNVQGRPLTEVLRNERASGTNQLTLPEMLTSKQVMTGGEPEVVTFEFPMKYDALTNAGEFVLLVDPIANDDSEAGFAAGECQCHGATNGNTLLVWNTIYEVPGKHALQAGLELTGAEGRDAGIVGPMIPFVVSNLCQFSLTSEHLEQEFGSTFRAKLVEQNASYDIEVTMPSGEHVRRLSGTTTNGMITAHWDLKDDAGNECTNNEYGSVIQIKLSESGREQRLKGP